MSSVSVRGDKMAQLSAVKQWRQICTILLTHDDATFTAHNFKCPITNNNNIQTHMNRHYYWHITWLKQTHWDPLMMLQIWILVGLCLRWTSSSCINMQKTVRFKRTNSQHKKYLEISMLVPNYIGPNNFWGYIFGRHLFKTRRVIHWPLIKGLYSVCPEEQRILFPLLSILTLVVSWAGTTVFCSKFAKFRCTLHQICHMWYGN